jgi:hypothetical protein
MCNMPGVQEIQRTGYINEPLHAPQPFRITVTGRMVCLLLHESEILSHSSAPHQFHHDTVQRWLVNGAQHSHDTRMRVVPHHLHFISKFVSLVLNLALYGLDGHHLIPQMTHLNYTIASMTQQCSCARHFSSRQLPSGHGWNCRQWCRMGGGGSK